MNDKMKKSDSIDSNTDDLQSWDEVPSIAHFCSLFRQAFDLLEFDIQELEESLLLMGTADDTLQLVPTLVIKLLRGCSRTFIKCVNETNYNTYLRRLFLSKSEEAEEDNVDYTFECEELLENDVDFVELSLRNRVRVLHQLCEFRLDAEDVSEKVKNLDATSLRVDPLGRDSEGNTYWYFYGTRLYMEHSSYKNDDKLKRRKEKEKKKRKKEKKKKKKKRNRDYSSSDDDVCDNSAINGWSVVCLTLLDWENLTDKMSKSKKKHDKELYDTLSQSFMPEIVKMFAEKEREEKKRLMLLAPKRTSTRIERKKSEQEKRDRMIAEQLEEERRIEESLDGRRTNTIVERDRAERIRQREQMKELRAKRLAEKEVELKFGKEVHRQKREQRNHHHDNNKRVSKRKEDYSKAKRRKSESDDEDDDDDDDLDDNNESSMASNSNDRISSPESSMDSTYHPPPPPKSPTKTNFTNALLRAGTKSTKDSNLDKPIRKSPGLLLLTAGLRKAPPPSGGPSSSSSSTLSSDSTEEVQKISFGLYGGHLPVDHGGYAKANGSDSDSNNDTHSSSISIADKPVRKVFSNWGGEFFKKNLDYRANTNKILEKMNLTCGTAANRGKEISSPFTKKGLTSLSTSSTSSSSQQQASSEEKNSFAGRT